MAQGCCLLWGHAVPVPVAPGTTAHPRLLRPLTRQARPAPPSRVCIRPPGPPCLFRPRRKGRDPVPTGPGNVPAWIQLAGPHAPAPALALRVSMRPLQVPSVVSQGLQWQGGSSCGHRLTTGGTQRPQQQDGHAQEKRADYRKLSKYQSHFFYRAPQDPGRCTNTPPGLGMRHLGRLLEISLVLTKERR